MGCCFSSPHDKRRYRDTADLDEEVEPFRYFGRNRAGSNLVPDDIAGLPSTHMLHHLASTAGVILYEAEIDHGKAFDCIRPSLICLLSPLALPWLLSGGLLKIFSICTCDESCMWLRKEYSTRTYFRVFVNRIEYNLPRARFPYGYLGCGSWNADYIVVNSFDRGAFGFSPIHFGSLQYLFCCWPVYGGVVARHRCQCNGPLWNRMFTDCGGWWCDEWLCQICFCSYHYRALADPEEVAFACSIALQAYFEGRKITKDDMNLCLEFWRKHISEQTDPLRRKRPVCCEPYFVPLPTGSLCYEYWTHPKRSIPNIYKGDSVTPQVEEIYEKYDVERARQIETYKNFRAPVRQSTLCRMLGCRRFFGRRGCCFCTEGCCQCNRSRSPYSKAEDPAPPLTDPDWDDKWDASSVLAHVLGPPPPNVIIRKWQWSEQENKYVIEEIPGAAVKQPGPLDPASEDANPNSSMPDLA